MLYRLLCVALFSICTFQTFAQKDDVSEKLNKDLVKRFPETASNTTITWRTLSYGYMAFYTISNQPKMSLYNDNGKFLKSYTQQSWETRAPENVKLEFDNSPYQTYSVINFWESDAANYKTFFLEMQDKEGISKEGWFDENGKYSATPF